jgi:hypothetical protein
VTEIQEKYDPDPIQSKVAESVNRRSGIGFIGQPINTQIALARPTSNFGKIHSFSLLAQRYLQPKHHQIAECERLDVTHL